MPFGEVKENETKRAGPGPVVPQWIKEWRIVGFTEGPEGLRVGIVRRVRGKESAYYAKIGEELVDGIKLVAANYDKEWAKLRNGADEREISMSGNSGIGSGAPAPPAPAVVTKPRPKVSGYLMPND